MDKVKEFFVKNRATIVAVMSAILTFVISLSQIDMGAKVGIVVSILLVIIPVIISMLNGSDMETTIKLLVNAITVIQTIVKENKVEVVEDDIVGIEYPNELTEEEIRELITKGL